MSHSGSYDFHHERSVLPYWPRYFIMRYVVLFNENATKWRTVSPVRPVNHVKAWKWILAKRVIKLSIVKVVMCLLPFVNERVLCALYCMLGKKEIKSYQIFNNNNESNRSHVSVWKVIFGFPYFVMFISCYVFKSYLGTYLKFLVFPFNLIFYTLHLSRTCCTFYSTKPIDIYCESKQLKLISTIYSDKTWPTLD